MKLFSQYLDHTIILLFPSNGNFFLHLFDVLHRHKGFDIQWGDSTGSNVCVGLRVCDDPVLDIVWPRDIEVRGQEGGVKTGGTSGIYSRTTNTDGVTQLPWWRFSRETKIVTLEQVLIFRLPLLYKVNSNFAKNHKYINTYPVVLLSLLEKVSCWLPKVKFNKEEFTPNNTEHTPVVI